MPRLPDLPAAEDFRAGLPTPSRGVNRVQAAEVSDAPARVAGMVTKLALEEADRLSEASADDALNKLREKRLDLTYGPEKGFTKLQGGAVIDRPVVDEYPALLQKEIDGLGANLRGSAAKAKFQQRATAELQSYRGDVYRHVAAQTDKFYTDTFNSSIEVGVKEAGTSLGMVSSSLARTAGAVDKEIARRGLTDPNQIAVFKQQYIGAVHAAAIEGMLNRGEAQAAGAYLEINKGSMSAKQVDALAPVVKKQSDWALGEDVGTQAAALDPKAAQDFITQKTKGNKDAYSAAQSVLTQREQAMAAADRQTKGGLVSQFSARPTRATMGKLQTTKDYLNLSPAARGELDEYMRHQVQAAEDRARGLADRADRIERQRWDENVGALETYYNLAQMPELGAMTAAQVDSYAPAIGPTLTNKLQAERARQAAGGKQFKFSTPALDSAMPPELLKPNNRAKKAAFLGLVEKNLHDWKAENPGKIPSDDDQAKILRSGNREFVRVDAGMFGRNLEVPAFEVPKGTAALPKEDYDTLTKSGVPDDYIKGALDWAAAKGRSMSAQDILNGYKRAKK